MRIMILISAALSPAILTACAYSTSGAQTPSASEIMRADTKNSVVLPPYGSTQSELDEFAFQLMDWHDIEYKHKLTGDEMMAIVRAKAAFDEADLAVHEKEYENRLVAVGKSIVGGQEYFIVDFQPRYVPVQKLPGKLYTESDQFNDFFPVEFYRFFVSVDDLSVEKYELIPQ